MQGQKGPLFDLNGRWIDINAAGSTDITISHDLTEDTVRADYAETMKMRCPPTAYCLRVAAVGTSARPAGSSGKMLHQICKRAEGRRAHDVGRR